MLTIAGGIILGFIGIVLISTPGFLSGLFKTARVLLAIAFLGGSVIAMFVARSEREGNLIPVAIGLGVVGIALLPRASSEPERRRGSQSRHSSTNDESADESFDRDRAADELLRRTPGAVVARERLVDIGITVAFLAVVRRSGFRDVLDQMLRAFDADTDETIVGTIKALYAADRMGTKTWAEAEAAMSTGGDALRADIRAWWQQRLAPFIGGKMVNYQELAVKPAFRAFVREVAAWTRGERAAAPSWWT